MRLLRQPALEGLTRSARTDSPRQVGRNKFRRLEAAAAAAGLERKRGGGHLLGSRTPQNPLLMLNTLSWVSMRNLESSTCVTLNGSGIQLAVGPQPLRLQNHNFGLAHRIMVRASSNIAP
ncbi:hypothetical protein F511_26974 [Dorcoceras hygrometricum]|uniref:Uncharacterized protein n=1 Tax=Dorcoceras hygrometricum TaxID=472368 RepID=A0A2Z7CNF5_9LAMI|nr:hypothetical protein F511_26974 [Dorcoceras hygrometricum]